MARYDLFSPCLPCSRSSHKPGKPFFQKGDFRNFDWTIKLDVSVAVAPERLRKAGSESILSAIYYIFHYISIIECILHLRHIVYIHTTMTYFHVRV